MLPPRAAPQVLGSDPTHRPGRTVPEPCPSPLAPLPGSDPEVAPSGRYRRNNPLAVAGQDSLALLCSTSGSDPCGRRRLAVEGALSFLVGRLRLGRKVRAVRTLRL